ncbi:hypothetical protein PybrP1_008424 [[Pythium] brassicae (nom. inval.)]|nr:hypothetical protein PybrP1_008424 [[Pythium] brassicae (nom. inval.)]
MSAGEDPVALELRGAVSPATASLVRGLAALYGDGLDVTLSADCDATADADVVAVVTSGNPTPVELHGRDAIAHWMRMLLDRRFATSAFTAAPSSDDAPPEPLRIFVSGDRSQVGKSTVCLGLVGALLRHGFGPSDVAYIKPATQCEQPQLVAKFCRQRGVACTDIGPIVFYAGFTREFLAGRTESAAALLASAREAVRAVGRGKKVVVVDGVGYPAVGSICGVSNAAVARAVQAPVVLVGKRGVGDAVDSFNLNASFFEQQGVAVLGAVFNRLPRDGYYSLDKCRESVTAYFAQYQPHKRVYGFIPEMEHDAAESDGAQDAPAATTGDLCDGTSAAGGNGAATTQAMTRAEAKHAQMVIDTFYEHVDLAKLLEDAERLQFLHEAAGGSASRLAPAPDAAKRALPESDSASNSDGGAPQKRSRADIQASARAAGAAGG